MQDGELLNVLLGPLGLLAFLLLGVVWGGVKKMWVWGWQYRELAADRDYWKDFATRSMTTAEKAATTAQTAVKGAHDLSDEELLEIIRRRGVTP